MTGRLRGMAGLEIPYLDLDGSGRSQVASNYSYSPLNVGTRETRCFTIYSSSRINAVALTHSSDER